ncbi:hypothetical protein B0J12DRAFT_156310 [Macrophomina phaseolina]|uniref:Uncharacterized protein n=1 Tax=Macrophomina phaseolina TaxID=35725 RepID=A0ABQ8G5K7_9PEZI|nr:hypothetical protein B0J12DRAFT_156310 [Macrophomina phaseolina]
MMLCYPVKQYPAGHSGGNARTWAPDPRPAGFLPRPASTYIFRAVYINLAKKIEPDDATVPTPIRHFRRPLDRPAQLVWIMHGENVRDERCFPPCTFCISHPGNIDTCAYPCLRVMYYPSAKTLPTSIAFRPQNSARAGRSDAWGLDCAQNSNTDNAVSRLAACSRKHKRFCESCTTWACSSHLGGPFFQCPVNNQRTLAE